MTRNLFYAIVKLVKQVRKSNNSPSFTKTRLNFAAKTGVTRMFVKHGYTARTTGNAKQPRSGGNIMAVPFVSRKRLNPRNLEAEGKFYPAPAYIAEIGVNQLAEDISASTTLTPTEVIGVIRSLLLTVPKYMTLGYKVRLDNFGIFKLGLKNNANCKGHEKASEVTASDIAGLKVLYTPDTMLLAKLEKPEYVKIDAKYLVEEAAPTGTDN